MSASTNPTSLMLTGHLPFVLLLAGLIAFPLSLLLLRLYKRAVVRSMRTSAATTVEPRDLNVAPETGANREAFRNADQLRDVALTAPRKAAVIYAAAGSAYAVVMTAAFLLASHIPFLPGRAVVLFWNFVWPVALAVMLIAAPTWRRKSVILVGYFAVLCGGSFFGLDWKQVVAIWAYANLGATLLLLFFLTRGIRAVGPMVFTFVLLALVGCEVAIDLLAYDVQHRGSVAHAALYAGLNAFSYLTLVAIVGIAVFSVFGWLGLRWIGRRYERKKVTDQSITSTRCGLFSPLCTRSFSRSTDLPGRSRASRLSSFTKLSSRSDSGFGGQAALTCHGFVILRVSRSGVGASACSTPSRSIGATSAAFSSSRALISPPPRLSRMSSSPFSEASSRASSLMARRRSDAG